MTQHAKYPAEITREMLVTRFGRISNAEVRRDIVETHREILYWKGAGYTGGKEVIDRQEFIDFLERILAARKANPDIPVKEDP